MMNEPHTPATNTDGGGRTSRHRPRWKTVAARLAWMLGGAALAAVLLLGPLRSSFRGPHPGGDARPVHSGQLWTCGMHPNVLEDEPGQCPICGMDLVPVREGDSGVKAPPATAAAAPASGEAKQLWTCGMHPNVLEDEPGQCPICGMDLVPVREGAGQPAAAAGSAPARSAAGGPAGKGKRKILFYRNPMDPTITSPVPRKDEMGMDYVPVYEDEAASAARQGAVVTIDPAVVQNMNVVVEPVSRRDITRRIRTVGYLDYDQEKMVSVTTKYTGYVEKSYVKTVGQPVRKGQPLFEIYSPELVQTEQELQSAARFVRQMADAPEDARRRAGALLDAARTRLAYWDITDDQVKKLEDTGEVLRTLTVVAPASGVVMRLMPGLDGMAVRPGMELLHVADLSSLWLKVEVFEDQLPWVKLGSEATVTFSYLPAETFKGKVSYIEPEVSEKSRTVSLTLKVPNRDHQLRAGMYATVLFEPVAALQALTVPSNAVIRTGERNIVVVDLGGGRFAPRDVALGAEGDGYVQVLSGLSGGEKVVTSSQFLIDSESNLREAIQQMIAARRKGGEAGQVE